jgi:hypothetical protein
LFVCVLFSRIRYVSSYDHFPADHRRNVTRGKMFSGRCGSFHPNSTKKNRKWHPWSQICLIIFHSKLQSITRKFLIPCWYFRALVFSLKILKKLLFLQKIYNLVRTFFIKILQKNSKLQSTWLKFCMYTLKRSINLFHMCFQQKIYFLYFF